MFTKILVKRRQRLIREVVAENLVDEDKYLHHPRREELRLSLSGGVAEELHLS